ncbi:restriction endonuclease subunit S [Porphyrobacter sp. ULC335]|uniref:restriction endonuclease subunit S n=1 Tax=Porphyrobacter sp. ULC335 TaxID=2854260 RepID=UPI002220F660|nr:restriction endonuclease subunit S [Porphyrobacter sp. ULC335]UYV15959.1 restriction endonuclease subunit S [Porphyrobacter sp. ULC335]
MSDIAALVADNLDIWTGAIERKSGAGRGGGNKRISLYGIERFRALILDLAVRGKLVPQEVGDEPALDQLANIRTSKPKYTKHQGLPKARVSPDAIDQVPFALPGGWAWSRLGDIAAYIQRGKSPKYSDGSGVYVVSQRCVQWSGLDLTVAKEISQASLSNYESYRFLKSGDLLWNSTGTGTIGRVIALDDVPDGLVCDSHVTLVRSPWVNARYLQAWLASDNVYGQIEAIAAGSTNQIEWTAQLASNQLVPLPPLAEQSRIVAKVDKLMALCDALERESADAMAAHQTLVEALLATLVSSVDAAELAANWARLESHFDTLFTTETSIDALKQTILDLAVRGKLLQQDVANWPVEPLGKYVKEAAAGWSPKCIETPRSDDNWGVLKVSAVTWGRFQPEENKELPPSLEPRPEIEVAPGDFLISRANTAELVARSVVVPLNAPRKLMMSDKIIRFRFNDKIDSEYVNLVHASPFARAYYARVAGGTSSSMKNVSQSQIRALAIPIPPLAEQHRIVAKVDELMALCDVLKARLADAAETRRHLADAIVERAAA